MFTKKDKINAAMGEVIDKAWEYRDEREGGVFDGIQKTVIMSLAILFTNLLLLII